MKDSFVIYRSVFDALMAFPSDEQKEALRMIGRYAMDDELPEDQSGIPYGLFLSVKPLIDNALKKSVERSLAGRKGGSKAQANESKQQANESKQQANRSKPEANQKQNEAYKLEIRNKKGEIINTVGSKEPMCGKAPQNAAEYPYKAICDRLNTLSGTAFKDKSKDTRKHIKARFEEGFTLEDFFTVIDKKVAEWRGTDMEKYLRPSTLFGTKFESYLNQCDKPSRETTKGQRDYYESDWTELL